MAERVKAVSSPSSLLDLAYYQLDAALSLRLYFSEANPNFSALFAGERRSEVADRLTDRLNETDLRSTLAVMARIEAAFRLDYQWRRDAKKPDPVSVAFRRLRRAHPRLDEDIWTIWKDKRPTIAPIISQLRGAFKFRHWLAHGRYWQAGQKYDYQTLYPLATAVVANFPLCA